MAATTPERIVGRLLRELAGTDLADLLAFATPERLAAGDGAAWSASAVRFHFGRDGTRSFDRRRLADALVEAVFADLREYAATIRARGTAIFARVRRRVEPLLADPRLTGTPAGRQVWQAAAELLSMADADRALADRAADAALATPLAGQPTRAALRGGWLLARLERFDDARGRLLGARAIAGRDDPETALADAMVGHLALLAGPLEDAVTAGDAAAASGHPIAAPWGTAVCARALLLCGDLDGAEDALAAAGPPGPPTLGATMLVQARAHVALAAGRPAEALDALRVVAEHRRRVGGLNPAGWWGTTEVEVRARLALGDRARAAAAVLAAAEVAGRWGTPVVLAELDRARAAVAEDHEAAVDPALAAERALRGSPAHVERLRCAWTVDRLLAGPLREDAHGTGLDPRHALLGGAAGTLEAMPVLTPRVREVAGLVAEGLRDQQIADRLGLSVRTVGRHVSTALRATGCRNRTELAVRLRR